MGYQDGHVYKGTESDLEVQWSGTEYIDVLVHDNSRPEDVPTVLAFIGLTLDEAERFAANLLELTKMARG